MQFVVVIPAYKPSSDFPTFVRELILRGAENIIVVDDGSGKAFQPLFDEVRSLPGTSVLRHGVNLGKGAALKTGMNAAYLMGSIAGVVTADADGQHRAEDVMSVAQSLSKQPNSLVMGVREFGPSVPIRSRVGNILTRVVTRTVVGWNLADTQTGLRGIPKALIPILLRIPTFGYEFELDMLIAARHHKFKIFQVPIQTIYIDGNRESHFDPIKDSMRIYFVLFRFGMLSFATALIDNGLFAASYILSSNVLASQIAGRLGGVLFNYTLARKAVFLSRERHRSLFPKYLLLVIVSGTISYSLISFFHGILGLGVVAAKLLSEALLFIANFCIQRDFVFRRSQSTVNRTSTDWDKYYKSVPATAKLTRKYTTSVLLGFLRKHLGDSSHRSIVEIGGANSCFIDAIVQNAKPTSYAVIDNNEYGLRLLQSKAYANGFLSLKNESVLSITKNEEADVVFSVGLIEHFNEADTRRAIQAHFRLLRPGGYAIISFPTPTLLYRVARRICEAAGLWMFHDERPLSRAEVLSTMAEEGDVLEEKLLWPLIFTQRIIVVRKRSSESTSASAHQGPRYESSPLQGLSRP